MIINIQTIDATTTRWRKIRCNLSVRKHSIPIVLVVVVMIENGR